MPVISPWLPDHEVPCGKITSTHVRTWTEHELLAKHVRLYKEIKQMIGELVALLKHEKVSLELF